MVRRVSRLFLQAWVLLLLDQDCRGPGRFRVGGMSDERLRCMIVEYHGKLYPDVLLTKKDVRTFLRMERSSRFSMLTLDSSARDNYVHWDNVTCEIRELRDLLSQRLNELGDVSYRMKREQIKKEGLDGVWRVLGVRE